MEDKTSNPEVDTKKEDNQSHVGVNKHEGKVVAVTPERKSSNFHQTYIIVAFIVIVVGVVGTLIYQHNHHSQLISACSDQSQLQNTQTYLENSANKQLSETVSEIKKHSGYKSNPNCMYIITAYYYVILDYQNASTSLKQLQNTDTSNVSATLTNYKSVTQLAASIKALSKFNNSNHFIGQQPNKPSSSGGSE